eukprot:jgi/Bigna1/79356/fgenesh1_pg.61_\
MSIPVEAVPAVVEGTVIQTEVEGTAIQTKGNVVDGQSIQSNSPSMSIPEKDWLIRAPKSSSSRQIGELGYLSAHDEIAKTHYAFVAYTEIDLKRQRWSFGVAAKGCASLKVDPYRSLRSKISKAAVKGLPYCVVGHEMKSRPGDSRMLQNRIYYDPDTLRATKFALHVCMRNADGSAQSEKLLTLEWPNPQLPEDKTTIKLPKDSSRYKNKELLHLSQYDVIADRDYELLAFVQHDIDKGTWKLHVKSSVTVSSVIDPFSSQFLAQLEKAAQKGQAHALFGHSIKPGPGNPRLMENRVYFNKNLRPTHIEIRLATRKQNSEARETSVKSAPWPETEEAQKRTEANRHPLISPPNSSDRKHVVPLGYICSRDNIASRDYAFSAYMEKPIPNPNGKWKLHVRSKETVSLSLDPLARSLESQISSAAKSGVGYCLVGHKIIPKPSDARKLEHRVYFDAKTLQPTKFALHLVTRDPEGKAKPERVLCFTWPGNEGETFVEGKIAMNAMPDSHVKLLQLLYGTVSPPVIELLDKEEFHRKGRQLLDAVWASVESMK